MAVTFLPQLALRPCPERSGRRLPSPSLFPLWNPPPQSRSHRDLSLKAYFPQKHNTTTVGTSRSGSVHSYTWKSLLLPQSPHAKGCWEKPWRISPAWSRGFGLCFPLAGPMVSSPSSGRAGSGTDRADQTPSRRRTVRHYRSRCK